RGNFEIASIRINILAGINMEMREIQLEIYKKMSPQKKLEIAFSLYNAARKLKAAGLRMVHTDWTEGQIKKEVTRIFLNART
ncbi:MAG: hypothetical protein WCS96_12525, partial [Victivallales bacterium]